MNPDTACTSDQWSVLTAAASNSQLAGVLGGFLITAIALLFDRSSREGVHTLALFSSSVLILMLDSFLYSYVSGTSPPPDNGDRHAICAMAWTQGSLATGMLAAGTTGLFGGLGWMLASHAVNKAPKDDPDDIRAFSFLADLGGWLTFAAALATTLILSETTIDYLRSMYGHSPSLWITGTIVTFCAIVILIDCGLVYVRTRTLSRSMANIEEPTRLELRSIKIATVCMVLLAIGASWVAVSLNRFPVDWVTRPNTVAVAFVVFLTLLLPTIISTSICYSVPSTSDRRERAVA